MKNGYHQRDCTRIGIDRCTLPKLSVNDSQGKLDDDHGSMLSDDIPIRGTGWAVRTLEVVVILCYECTFRIYSDSSGASKTIWTIIINIKAVPEPSFLASICVSGTVDVV
jgi:hypothetical protein